MGVYDRDGRPELGFVGDCNTITGARQSGVLSTGEFAAGREIIQTPHLENISKVTEDRG